MNNPVRFALLGYGHIGKRHANILQALPGGELAAICDNDSAAAAAAPAGIPFYDSFSALLQAEKNIDIVSIATPNGWHVPHALQALDAGLHVLVEKPLGLGGPACKLLLEKARQKQLQVFCVMQNRYSPSLVWIKEMVDSGRLGQVFMIKADCFWSRDAHYYTRSSWKGTMDMDGGTLYTQFSHFIDVIYWLFGNLLEVKADFFDFNHTGITDFEDSGIIRFRSSQGAAGLFSYSTAVWDKNFESTLTITAANGTIKIGGQYMNELQYCHVKDYTPPFIPAGNPANTYGGYTGSAANHSYVFENVVRKLGGQPAVTTAAEEGLKVVEIIENIYLQRNKSRQEFRD